MTIKHDIWKYIHSTDTIPQCVGCKRIRYDEEFHDYFLPREFHRKVTGTLCKECLANVRDPEFEGVF